MRGSCARRSRRCLGYLAERDAKGGGRILVGKQLNMSLGAVQKSVRRVQKLTDALCEATHPGLRDHTWVIVEGHNPKNWGLGGKPWPVDAMPPPPSS